jgi:hypothetical protein
VAFISSAKVAPLGFFRRAMTRALLLAWPGVAALALGRRFGAFLPRLGLRVDFAFVVAAGGFRAAAPSFPRRFFHSGQFMCEFNRTDHILATPGEKILAFQVEEW